MKGWGSPYSTKGYYSVLPMKWIDPRWSTRVVLLYYSVL